MIKLTIEEIQSILIDADILKTIYSGEITIMPPPKGLPEDKTINISVGQLLDDIIKLGENLVTLKMDLKNLLKEINAHLDNHTCPCIEKLKESLIQF